LSELRKEKDTLVSAEKQDRRSPTAPETSEPPKPRNASDGPKDDGNGSNGNGTTGTSGTSTMGTRAP